MGVPAFFRWLSEKYPKIITDVLDDRVHLAHESGSIRQPFDSTRPNPSGIECDNFYIDMNGIIHPCSHPEVGPQPKTEEEMYENVCRYVDRLFRTIRPRKLLYLAIDGVAPRAKMNQQRSRRFRSAQEMREKKELENELKDGLIKAGHQFESTKDPWDSNVITPGTKFMINLSEYLRFYIRKRISTDKAWKNITVIFSDASIPGEGEHKIMAHIRHQRNQPSYNPNLVHVLHGLDADLIMLALATHEAHFYILREEVVFGRKGSEQSERRKEESGFADAQKQLDEAAGAVAMHLPENQVKPLQRISIPILREYLAFEFQECNSVPFHEVSFERLLDDIVFLCFFVGNDFLPHLPSLDIRDGALDYLFNVYKRILPTLGDYITNHGGEVNLSHVDVILAEVGAIEDFVFNMKHKNEQQEQRRREQFKDRKKHLTKNGQAPLANSQGGRMREDVPKVRGKAARILEQDSDMKALGKDASVQSNKHSFLQQNAKAAEALKVSLAKVEDTEDNAKLVKIKAEDISKHTEGKKETEISQYDREEEAVDQAKLDQAAVMLKHKIKEIEQKKLNDYAANVEDKVRLHDKGWKNRYYTDKCKADDVEENGGREHLFRNYVMGLCWVMKYYYDGCPSWKWFYPFHYAPFASDLKNIERFRKDCSSFDMGEPFKPMEQLMAVFPEDSAHAIPKPSRWLMSDTESPILDFYPKEIACDPNGKAMPWLWVVLLPFIDEERLLAALKPTEKEWTEVELFCNSRGLDDGYIYCHVAHSLASSLTPVVDATDPKTKLKIEDNKIFGELRQPLSNEIYPLDKRSVIHPPKSAHRINSENVDELLTSPLDPNAALCAAFTEPMQGVHMSIILGGAQPPSPILRNNDLRIRRPRLNRGGGTIANLGTGSSGQSHQSGYGSMNISSYERDLAQKNGRGHQMNQAGTRAWGAMEPTNKRQKGGNQYQHPQQQHQQQYRPSLFQQPFQHGNHHAGNAQNRGQNNYHNQPNNDRNQGGRWQPQQQRPVPPPRFQPPPPNPQGRPPQQMQGHNFQQFSTNTGPPQRRVNQPFQQSGRGHPPQRQGQNRSGVSASVMSNLRSQLKSTLNKNKK